MVTPIVREVSHERAAELMREIQADLAKHAVSKERETEHQSSGQPTGR